MALDSDNFGFHWNPKPKYADAAGRLLDGVRERWCHPGCNCYENEFFELAHGKNVSMRMDPNQIKEARGLMNMRIDGVLRQGFEDCAKFVRIDVPPQILQETLADQSLQGSKKILSPVAVGGRLEELGNLNIQFKRLKQIPRFMDCVQGAHEEIARRTEIVIGILKKL